MMNNKKSLTIASRKRRRITARSAIVFLSLLSYSSSFSTSPNSQRIHCKQNSIDCGSSPRLNTRLEMSDDWSESGNDSNKWTSSSNDDDWQDQVNAKADLAVLVTETYPSGMDKFGQKDGVWICSFHEAKSVSFVLREMLKKTHSVKSSEENKGGKMEMLYSYLNGNEFIQTITRILEVYTNMESDLNTEKRAMTKIWKTREKQIEVVALNISSMFGSIKGIAGNDLASSSILKLPDSPSEE